MGLDLLLCLNPLVPFDATHPERPRVPGQAAKRIPQPGPRRPAGGAEPDLPLADPLAAGTRHAGYESSHPDTDILLFEPDQRDPEMFLANTFGYGSAAGWPSMPTSLSPGSAPAGAP
jgi:NTE family protein